MINNLLNGRAGSVLGFGGGNPTGSFLDNGVSLKEFESFIITPNYYALLECISNFDNQLTLNVPNLGGKSPNRQISPNASIGNFNSATNALASNFNKTYDPNHLTPFAKTQLGNKFNNATLGPGPGVA